jgi:hypothetical protein
VKLDDELEMYQKENKKSDSDTLDSEDPVFRQLAHWCVAREEPEDDPPDENGLTNTIQNG